MCRLGIELGFLDFLRQIRNCGGFKKAVFRLAVGSFTILGRGRQIAGSQELPRPAFAEPGFRASTEKVFTGALIFARHGAFGSQNK